MEENEVKILSELVIDELRMNFLPFYFGPHYLQGEGCIYDWAGRLSKEYSGGHWVFFTLSNGGFYVAPDLRGPVHVE